MERGNFTILSAFPFCFLLLIYRLARRPLFFRAYQEPYLLVVFIFNNLLLFRFCLGSRMDSCRGTWKIFDASILLDSKVVGALRSPAPRFPIITTSSITPNAYKTPFSFNHCPPGSLFHLLQLAFCSFAARFCLDAVVCLDVNSVLQRSGSSGLLSFSFSFSFLFWSRLPSAMILLRLRVDFSVSCLALVVAIVLKGVNAKDVPCNTIASDYPRLTRNHIHIFRCNWTLQEPYS